MSKKKKVTATATKAPAAKKTETKKAAAPATKAPAAKKAKAPAAANYNNLKNY